MTTSNPHPATLGKYEIRGVLGRGAMGIVYDGWDPVIGRRVAIKAVRVLEDADAEAEEGLARFKREAQAAGRLSHPNIVGVHDYGETGEVAFIVMEFVQGHSLKERLDAHDRFPVGETVRIMEQVLAALQFSHDRSVIHRDIKPGNVMITEDGQAKLADFGIARIESSVMTQVGTMLGTPAYMSPEQLMAQSVDARSDLYSAGVMLYQLLTGERPYEGGLTAIIHKALNTVPPRPSEISVTAPPSLDPVVARAMARRPADRYQSATEFAHAIRDAYEAADPLLPAIGIAAQEDATILVQRTRAAAKNPPLVAVPAARRRKPLLLAGMVAVLLLVVGGGAWVVLQRSTPVPLHPDKTAEPFAQTPEQVSRTMTSLPATQPSPLAMPSGTQPEPSAPVPPAPATQTTFPQAQLIESPKPETRVLEVTPVPQSVATKPAADRMALALPNPTAIRESLASLARSARCALPRFSVSDEGRVSVSGLVGAGGPDTALREAAQAAAPAATLSWEARSVEGPYCDMFDILSSIAQPSSPFLGLALKDDATRLREHDPILPILKLPEFSAYLQVDYFSHDGSVAHLYPVRNVANLAFAPNGVVPLGTSKNDRVEVAPPFGTDMIVAIASSIPLFPPGHVREDETMQAYLPALRVALESARRKNAKLTGRAMVLETVP